MARDYRAEYRARVERGTTKGLTPSQAAGQQTRYRESSRRQPREQTVTVGRRRVEVVQSSDRSYVMRRLRQAAAEGKNVVIYGVWQTDTGYGTQVYGGKAHTHASSRTGDRMQGKLRVMIATRDTMVAVAGTSGTPAQRIIDELGRRDEEGDRIYDSLDDYMGDWWDDEEGEYDSVPAAVGRTA